MGRMNGLNKILDSAAQVLLLLYTAECVFGSSGRWLEIGPLSIRMVLFILAFMTSLPAVVRNFREIIRNGQVACIASLGLWLLVCTAIGWREGHDRGFIWADISSLLPLALVPGFMSVMRSKKAISRLIDTVFWTAAALAGVTVALHFLCAVLSTETLNGIYQWVKAANLGRMDVLKTGILRLYMRSQIYFQVAIVFGVWKIGSAGKEGRGILYFAEGLLLCGCILSYTRGFWLGLAVSAVLLLLLGTRYWKVYFRTALRMLAVFALFTALSSAVYHGPAVVIEVVNRLNPNLIVLSAPQEQSPEETGSNDPENDTLLYRDQRAVWLREESLRLHRDRIREHPLVGSGLGENLDEVRSDGRTEYMYLDMTMKTGLIGLVLLLLSFFGFVPKQLCHLIRSGRRDLAAGNWTGYTLRNCMLTAAYLGVAVTSIFNPFLMNPLGITLMSIVSTAVYSEEM